LLTLTIPSTGLTFEIPQGHKVASSSDARSTKISAVIAQGRNISIQWRRALEPTEKLPAKVYGESHYLVSIEEDALSVDVDINLQILHSEISELQLVVPDGVSVLSIAGPNLGEWSEIQVGGERRLVIPFTYGIKGQAQIQLRAEATLTESGLANAVSGFQVAGITRETGSIGIELNTSAEVLVVTRVGLEPVAVQKLPAELINKSSKPLMFGFRLTKNPFELVLDIKKHEKIAVPVATVTSASAVSLFTEDGKIVHRLVYQVRNNSKQFLEFSASGLSRRVERVCQ